MRNRIKIALPFLVSLLIISCKKEPGPGGLASVKGKVYAYDFTSGKTLISEGYLGEIRVYIGAADGSEHFDDIRTSYDGSYQFNFLRKGKYKVWVFAKSDTAVLTSPEGQQHFIQEVEVTDKKGEVEVPDFKVNI
ncbi:MAG: hypothetical protein JNL72_03535 [Flavipsychrobacter sp.]|nr:hypothetical protein [Flavipsychrobacter sp.]